MLGFCHVVKDEFQKDCGSQSATFEFEVCEAHWKICLLDIFDADEGGIFHSSGELVAALAVFAGTFVVGDFFDWVEVGEVGEIFAAYVFVAGFAGAAIDVAAFVAEKFYFVFLFLWQACQLV